MNVYNVNSNSRINIESSSKATTYSCMKATYCNRATGCVSQMQAITQPYACTFAVSNNGRPLFAFATNLLSLGGGVNGLVGRLMPRESNPGHLSLLENSARPPSPILTYLILWDCELSWIRERRQN